MKKVVLSVITAVLIVPQAFAFNALKEHSLYRSELNSLAGKQHAENQKNMLYYKGPANYTVTQMRYSSSSTGSSAKKDIYVKKGVKFKVDEAKQEQRLKEAKEAESKEVKKETNVQTVRQKSEQPAKPVEKSTVKTESKSVASKPAASEKPKTQKPKSIQMPQVELSKVNVNIPVKNLVKPVAQKSVSKPEPVRIPANGKNADAE